jgi:hypothetical protein
MLAMAALVGFSMSPRRDAPVLHVLINHAHEGHRQDSSEGEGFSIQTTPISHKPHPLFALAMHGV